MRFLWGGGGGGGGVWYMIFIQSLSYAINLYKRIQTPDGCKCSGSISADTHDAMTTSSWRQNDVATSFWRHNGVVIALRARFMAATVTYIAIITLR